MKASLNGHWKFLVDSDNQGESKNWWDPEWIEENFASMEDIKIPNCWNNSKGLDRFEGTIWFFVKFDKIQGYYPNSDLYLKFNAVNYYSKVWFDAAELGEHYGGFLPFSFKILPDFVNMRETHFLAVKVDNFRRNDGIPCASYDWYNWGGIFRDVEFIILDRTRIDWVGVKPKILDDNKAQLNVNYEIMDNQEKDITKEPFEGEVEWSLYYLGNISTRQRKIAENSSDSLDSSATPENNQLFDEDEPEEHELDVIDDLMREEISLEDLKNLKPDVVSAPTEVKDVSGVLIKSGSFTVNENTLIDNFSINIENPNLWTPKNPELYQISLFLKGTTEQKLVRFGIREIRSEGCALFLNNKRIWLHGVSLHEELVPYGRSIPIEERRKDVLAIKSLGMNALRTGHYPHDESIYSIADEEGLLVYEEIPVYWGIDFKNMQTLKLARLMLKTMIQRDFNHPCIINWSCGNEIPVGGDIACQYFMANLTQYAKSLDDTRMISWVSLPSFTTLPAILKPTTDVYNMNIYLGWYYLSPYNMSFLLDSIHAGTPDKPIVISEFGAGAKYGYHQKLKKFTKFSEERQASVIGHEIKVMNTKDYVAGWFIWIYRDFRSHRRVNKYQTGYNRKGIVSEKNEKKIIARWMPDLVNFRYTDGQYKEHRLTAKLFQVLGWPAFKFTNIMANLFSKFSGLFHGGDQYYTNIRENSD